MVVHDLEANLRQQAVSRAVANLRARGVNPAPAVLAFYARYGRGKLSRGQVQALMHQRAEALVLKACLAAARLAEKYQAYAGEAGR
ncbi:MAG: hypothetical protein ACRYFV_07905 [Janthinobacterium lividum]